MIESQHCQFYSYLEVKNNSQTDGHFARRMDSQADNYYLTHDDANKKNSHQHFKWLQPQAWIDRLTSLLFVK